MIPLLRAGSLAVNGALFLGAPLLAGVPFPGAAAIAAALFAASWWACGRAPGASPAPPEVIAAAERVARRMGAPPPRGVRSVAGWTAAAFRARDGYGILLGRDVEEPHREAVLAHEIAHYVRGDLFWEPWTDGPARILAGAATRVPPLWVIALPFLFIAAPLARATELAADRLAAGCVSSYPAVLSEVALKMGGGQTLFYPALHVRVRHAARHSKEGGVKG